MLTTKPSPKRKTMSVAMLAAISAMATAPVFAVTVPCDVTASSSSFSLNSGNCTAEAGATVLGVTGSAAVTVNGVAGTLTNQGSLVGDTSGLSLTVGGSLDTLVNVGLITGVKGISNSYGTLGAVTNSGTISSSGTMLTPGAAAVYNTSQVSSIENTGSIVGGEYGEGIENGILGTIGTVTNETGGTISGGLYAVQNLGDVGSLTNRGLISANAGAGVAALQNGLGATITTLENSGTIIGTGTMYPTAVFNDGYIGSIVNTGSIVTAGAQDATTDGLTNDGTIATVDNSGTIAGSAAGVGFQNGPGSSVGTLTNTGTIGGLLNSGSIGALDNREGGSFTTSATATSAVANLGTIASLTNEGLLGNADGSSTTAVKTTGGEITSLDNSGSIIGSTAISNGAGTIAALRNETGAVIAGGVAAVNNAFAGNLGTLTNLGAMTTSGVGAAAILNSGAIGALTNSGTIQSALAVASATGIANHGTINTFSNAGVIGGTGVGAGLVNDGTIQSVDNQGQVAGVQNIFGAAINTYIGQLTNEASGVIVGTGVSNGAAVDNGNATIASLTNAGEIGSAEGVSSPIGVRNGGVIGSISNTGVIGGATFGLQNNGTIASISNVGQISAGTAGVGQMALENTNVIGAMDNTGTISAQTGVENFGTITTLTNDATGTIGGSVGLLNIGHVGSISNAGNIGNLSQGIQNVGVIGSIDNSGTISSLINTGTIGAGSGAAITNEVGGNLGMLTNSGVISGDIENFASTTLTIMGGTGTSVGTFTGLGGAIGNIGSLNADVVLTGGKVLLNDDIDLGGVHTLSNTLGTIQINSQLAVNGNYQQSSGAALLLGVADSANATGSLTADSGYGRLVVSGDAIIEGGSSVGLQKLASYAFAPGQRFVVVDAGGANTNYNASALRLSATGFTGSVTGQDVVNDGRHDLVLTLAAASSGAGGAGTGGGNGSGSDTGAGTGSNTSGEGNSGTSGGNSSTGSDSGSTTGAPGEPVTTGSTGSTTATGSVSGGSTAALPNVPTSPQAVAAFNGLMRYIGSSNAHLLNLYDAVDALAYTGSADQVNRAGQQLSPLSQAASASHAAAAPTLDVLNIVGARTSSLRLADGGSASGVATGDGTPRVGVWGQAFGGHASQDARDQIDGYSANYAGVLVGVDTALTPNWVAGGVFAYSNTAVNNTGSTAGDSTRVSAYGLTGYASYSGDPWYVNLSAGVTPQHFNTTREVNFEGFSGQADGSFSGQQYVARAEFGVPLQLAYATLTPEATLTYSYSHQSAYQESGGNGAALAVDAMHDTSVRSSLGARIERGFKTSYGEVVPQVSANWVHEFDHSRVITGASYAADATGQTAFTTVGASPIGDYADLGLGVTMLRASNLSVTARYELQAGKGFVSQTGSLRLRQQF